jgi:hypothetical protein
MKKTLCLLALALSCALLVACFNNGHDNEITQDGDVIMRIAIFPSGGTSDTYLFEIKQDGTMLCQFGVSRGKDIQTKKFYRDISEQKETRLSDEDMKRLTALAEELYENGLSSEKRLRLDSWDVALSYRGEVYEADYYDNPSEAYRNLVDEVIQLSPLPVDLHGWA